MLMMLDKLSWKREKMSEVTVTGTLIWYYYICKREVWLMARQIVPEQENPHIELGRFISDTTYKRDKKQIHLEGITLDLAKLDDEKLVIGEVKKSSKFRDSAKMQLCFYLYVLRDYGIEAEGELLFQKEKGVPLPPLSHNPEERKDKSRVAFLRYL